MFGLGLESGFNYYLIHFILLVLFVILVDLLYFRRRRTKGGFFKGLLLGIIFVIVGIILDSALTIPLWILPQGGSYSEFLFDRFLLIGELVVIVVSAIVGALRK